MQTVPGGVVAVDISDVEQNARPLPTHSFASWEEAERHFLSLGAPQEALDSVADALKETGTAKASVLRGGKIFLAGRRNRSVGYLKQVLY